MYQNVAEQGFFSRIFIFDRVKLTEGIVQYKTRLENLDHASRSILFARRINRSLGPRYMSTADQKILINAYYVRRGIKLIN